MSLEDIVDSVALDADYGYQGRLDDIRREEYSNLGGTWLSLTADPGIALTMSCL